MTIRMICWVGALTLLASSEVAGQLLPYKRWGIGISPGASGGRTNPFFPASGFEYTEPLALNGHLSFMVQRFSRKWQATKSVGASRYMYVDDWNQPNGANYISGKRPLVFLEGSYSVGRRVNLGNTVLVAEAGLLAGWLVYARHHSITTTGTANRNLLGDVDQWNLGYSASVRLIHPLTENASLVVGPVYKKLLVQYPFNLGITPFHYGLQIDLLFGRP